MVDHETESLWSHLLGGAMQGPLKGEQLEIVTGLLTDWETWKSRYPETSVAMMDRTSNRYRRGELAQLMAFGVCLVLDEQPRAWPLPLSEEQGRHGVVNDQLGERSLLIYYDQHSETAAIYDRMLDEQELTFVIEEDTLRDQETKSTWDPILGLALTGPLKDKRLVSLPGIMSELSVWSVYHPDGTFWSPHQDTSQPPEVAPADP